MVERGNDPCSCTAKFQQDEAGNFVADVWLTSMIFLPMRKLPWYHDTQ